MREELIASAVTFLSDPTVQSSPLTKRIAFLESKELTQEEINEAIKRSQNGHPATTIGNGVAPAIPGWQSGPPPLPGRDWRDYFVMAVTTAGVSYGLYTLAKRYVLPLIQPPTPAALEQDKSDLTATLEATSSLLTQLQSETATLLSASSEQQSQITAALAKVETVIAETREANEKRDGEVRRMREEIEGIRGLVPKAVEKVRERSERSLEELAGELRSLKSLLQSRVGATGERLGTGGVGHSPVPWLNQSNSVSSAPKSPAAAGAGAVGDAGSNAFVQAMSPSSEKSSFLDRASRSGIPAWQLAASEKADAKGQDEYKKTTVEDAKDAAEEVTA